MKRRPIEEYKEYLLQVVEFFRREIIKYGECDDLKASFKYYENELKRVNRLIKLRDYKYLLILTDFC